MTVLDEEALRRRGEPASVELLLEWAPVLDASLGPVALRERSAALFAALPEQVVPDGVTRTVLDGPGGTQLRIFEPAERRLPGTAVLWIHGGGLIAGTPAQNDLMCAGMAVDNGCPVVATSYGLAPEAPYPQGLNDCQASLDWLLAGKLGVHRVLLAGASAGGCLALATGLAAKERGLTSVIGLFLAYPMLDDRDGRPSMEQARVSRTWHRDVNRMAWDAYLAGLDPVPYLAAPGRAGVEDLRGLPPVYLDVGTLDAFFDEDVELANKLARADVAVELVVTPRAFHASEMLAPDAPSSRRILAARRSAMARLLAD